MKPALMISPFLLTLMIFRKDCWQDVNNGGKWRLLAGTPTTAGSFSQTNCNEPTYQNRSFTPNWRMSPDLCLHVTNAANAGAGVFVMANIVFF
jgi:hypothetical protein